MFLGRECPEVRKSRPGQKPLSTCEFALLPAALCNSHANSYKEFDLDKSFVFQFPSDISRPSLHSPSLVQAATMVFVWRGGEWNKGRRKDVLFLLISSMNVHAAKQHPPDGIETQWEGRLCNLRGCVRLPELQ